MWCKYNIIFYSLIILSLLFYVESDKLDVENRDPQKLNSNKAIYCTNPLKETPVELSKPVHRVDRPGAGIQSKDVPQNCNTS